MIIPNKVIYFFIVLLLFVLVAIVATNEPSETNDPIFTKFYNDNLNGKLSLIIPGRATQFRLGSSNYTYEFYPKTNERLNNRILFQRFAKIGDYVRKPAKSDTLFLEKDGRIYKYTFQMFKK